MLNDILCMDYWLNEFFISKKKTIERIFSFFLKIMTIEFQLSESASTCSMSYLAWLKYYAHFNCCFCCPLTNWLPYFPVDLKIMPFCFFLFLFFYISLLAMHGIELNLDNHDVNSFRAFFYNIYQDDGFMRFFDMSSENVAISLFDNLDKWWVA